MECGDLRGHHVGAPLPSIQLKLRPWEEGGYSPYDEPSPRGEILISGGSVTRGYYKKPDTTAEAFFTDKEGVRWFCTGELLSLSLFKTSFTHTPDPLASLWRHSGSLETFT